ncbi:hypothetical protein AU188_13515 [Mycobacterium sp. IS-3022]|nr:hypothetical protein AU188_13515 [Mycobacterium sp. IS-3022]
MSQANLPDRTADDVPAGGFESVLTAAAMNTWRGRVPGAELSETAYVLARQPGPALNRAARAAREIATIVRGIDDTPGAHDGRFADAGWQDNAVLRRVALGYLAGSAAVEDIVSHADVTWRTKERVRLFVDNVVAAAAPSNNPLLNPASLKRAVDTAGANWIRGLRSLAADSPG